MPRVVLLGKAIGEHYQCFTRSQFTADLFIGAQFKRCNAQRVTRRVISVSYTHLDVYKRQNKRVIDVDYSLIVYKEVSEASIDDITDATAKTAGFLGTLFNYGNVMIQTPGTNQSIEFLSIPEPDTVGSTINKMTANK